MADDNTSPTPEVVKITYEAAAGQKAYGAAIIDANKAIQDQKQL